jgi:hypothetical protein
MLYELRDLLARREALLEISGLLWAVKKKDKD